MAFLSWNCFYFLIFFRGSFVKWNFSDEDMSLTFLHLVAK